MHIVLILDVQVLVIFRNRFDGGQWDLFCGTGSFRRSSHFQISKVSLALNDQHNMVSTTGTTCIEVLAEMSEVYCFKTGQVKRLDGRVGLLKKCIF